MIKAFLDWFGLPVEPNPRDPLARVEAGYDRGQDVRRRLSALRSAVERGELILDGSAPQRIAECMVVEHPDRLRTTYATASMFAGEALRIYRDLIAACGAAALEPMRWVLRQTTRPARWVWEARPPIGAKTIAFEVVERHGDESDEDLFGRLLDDDLEDGWVRLAVGLHLLRRSADDSLTRRFVDIMLTTSSLLPAEAVAQAGPRMIEHLVPNLGHPEYQRRHRATELLKHLGDAAVPALRDVVATSESYEAVANAELALKAIAPQAVEEAHRERERGSRGLSRADVPKPDAGRGLSRSDEP